MSNTRVVFISEIAAGSKFRAIANNMARAGSAKKTGIKWASCQVNDAGGNFQRPSFHDTAMPPIGVTWRQFMGTVIKVYPPTFNIFNRPCPRAINYNFPQVEDPVRGSRNNYMGFPLIP
jgi:hypothetical protein